MAQTILKTLFSLLWNIVKSFRFILIPLAILFVILIIDFIVVKFRFFKHTKQEVIGHVNYDGKVSLFEQIFILLPKQYWTNYYTFLAVIVISPILFR